MFVWALLISAHGELFVGGKLIMGRVNCGGVNGENTVIVNFHYHTRAGIEQSCHPWQHAHSTCALVHLKQKNYITHVCAFINNINIKNQLTSKRVIIRHKSRSQQLVPKPFIDDPIMYKPHPTELGKQAWIPGTAQWIYFLEIQSIAHKIKEIGTNSRKTNELDEN